MNKSCKQDETECVEKLALGAESGCGKGDIKALYNITRQLSGRTTTTRIDLESNSKLNSIDGKNI